MNSTRGAHKATWRAPASVARADASDDLATPPEMPPGFIEDDGKRH